MPQRRLRKTPSTRDRAEGVKLDGPTLVEREKAPRLGFEPSQRPRRTSDRQSVGFARPQRLNAVHVPAGLFSAVFRPCSARTRVRGASIGRPRHVAQLRARCAPSVRTNAPKFFQNSCKSHSHQIVAAIRKTRWRVRTTSAKCPTRARFRIPVREFLRPGLRSPERRSPGVVHVVSGPGV